MTFVIDTSVKLRSVSQKNKMVLIKLDTQSEGFIFDDVGRAAQWLTTVVALEEAFDNVDYDDSDALKAIVYDMLAFHKEVHEKGEKWPIHLTRHVKSLEDALGNLQVVVLDSVKILERDHHIGGDNGCGKKRKVEVE